MVGTWEIQISGAPRNTRLSQGFSQLGTPDGFREQGFPIKYGDLLTDSYMLPTNELRIARVQQVRSHP